MKVLFLMIIKLILLRHLTQPLDFLDDLLNIDNPYSEGMVNKIVTPEMQLNKANTSDTEASFLDLHLSISNGFFPPKFMINAMTLIFILLISPFWMAMFHGVPLMGCIFINL